MLVSVLQSKYSRRDGRKDAHDFEKHDTYEETTSQSTRRYQRDEHEGVSDYTTMKERHDRFNFERRHPALAHAINTDKAFIHYCLYRRRRRRLPRPAHPPPHR